MFQTIDNMTKPTVIFVPGAFHPASCWDNVRSSLTRYSFETVAISLPGVGAGSKVTSHHEDTAAIRKVLSQLIVEEQKDVVLVMHSYGGVPGSEAVRGLEKSIRGKETPGACGVIHCVYLSGFLVPTGASFLGLLGGTLPDSVIRDVSVDISSVLVGLSLILFMMKPKDDRYLLPNDPATAFYNDVSSPSIQFECINKLSPTAYAVLASEVEYTCCQAETVPCTYLICEKDNVVPPAVARAMIESVCKKGKMDTEVVCDSGHSPWLTKVEVVVELIRKAACEAV